MMRRGKRRQRVTLRSKVRRERFGRIRSFLFGKFAFVVLFAIAAGALHRFLFVSDFFMIKSFEVSEADPKIASEMKSKVSRFKGRSAFSLDLGSAERDWMKQYPQLRSLKVARVLPDGIKVEYSLRQPVALVKSDGREDSMKALDSEGAVFPAALTPSEAAELPEAVLPAAEDRQRALAFLAAWKEAESDLGQGGDPLALRKLTLDQWNELNVYVRSPAFGGQVLRIVWGAYDASTFDEKYRRLRDVWRDLVARSIEVEYVNLRGVPQRSTSALGEEREVVGRVIVRPKTKISQAEPKSNLKG